MENLRQYARMTIAPEKIPPEPSPAIARPTIRALLVGAVAQTRELGFVSDCCCWSTEGERKLTRVRIGRWQRRMWF